MMTLRRGTDRGRARFGWLDSHHTFSFGNYYDPAHMGFRALRVINDDRIVPGAGFPTHPHRDMEIISYVVEGALEHKDSMGNGSVIVPGDVQRMTAGRGVTHSEFNASQEEGTRFLQIWILPDEKNLDPGYEQKRFPIADRRDELRLVVSKDGREGSVTVHQDVAIYTSALGKGSSLRYETPDGRHAWIQVVNGGLEINGTPMEEGDGLQVSPGVNLNIQSRNDTEFLLFDLA
ncbi:MAG: pirin family protein [Myxococcales bacterium]|nr:pirin family protein [Myxococcales bacterium]